MALWTLGKAQSAIYFIRNAQGTAQTDLSAACIDEFAVAKGKRYGTALVDIGSHRIMDLLDSKNFEDVAEWLGTYPDVAVFSRDGSNSYRSAIDKAHPDAIQISDRFHLIKSLADKAESYLMSQPKADVPNTGDEMAVEPTPEITKAIQNRCLTSEEKYQILQQLRADG